MAIYFRPVLVMGVAISILVVFCVGMVFVLMGGLYLYRAEKWAGAYRAECCFTDVVASRRCDRGVCSDGDTNDRCFGHQRYYQFNITVTEDPELSACANLSVPIPSDFDDYNASTASEIAKIFSDVLPLPIHSWYYQGCEQDNDTFPSCGSECRVKTDCSEVSFIDPEEDRRIGIILLSLGLFGIMIYCCFCCCFLLFRRRLRTARRTVKKNVRAVGSAVGHGAKRVHRKVLRKKKKKKVNPTNGATNSESGSSSYTYTYATSTQQGSGIPISPLEPPVLYEATPADETSEGFEKSTSKRKPKGSDGEEMGLLLADAGTCTEELTSEELRFLEQIKIVEGAVDEAVVKEGEKEKAEVRMEEIEGEGELATDSEEVDSSVATAGREMDVLTAPNAHQADDSETEDVSTMPLR